MKLTSMKAIIECLDNYMTRKGLKSINAIEANAVLSKAGLLADSKERPGKPLRDLLRKGKLPHAYQTGGKGSSWIIPLSKAGKAVSSNYQGTTQWVHKTSGAKPKTNNSAIADTSDLKGQLERARLKYKPENVKYLLIAEAPPDSIERFFYYENVHQHDHLFLGVAQALYPDLKENYMNSRRSSDIKKAILLKFKADGFYLLDLSELPLSLMTGDLNSQIPTLIQKINKVADENTKIILIKATVYDTAFQHLLNQGFLNLANVRIPFPGQGGQKLFQMKFKEALKMSGRN